MNEIGIMNLIVLLEKSDLKCDYFLNVFNFVFVALRLSLLRESFYDFLPYLYKN